MKYNVEVLVSRQYLVEGKEKGRVDVSERESRRRGVKEGKEGHQNACLILFNVSTYRLIFS